ncbi:MAG: DUF5696 domain-containing protein [Oscillospiraceae bacterium]|nr:DUF5696 domain-containing protein [Oscillospiraceae bacterium]
MKKKFLRLIAGLLVITMLMSMTVFTAVAEDEEEEATAVSEEVVDGSEPENDFEELEVTDELVDASEDEIAEETEDEEAEAETSNEDSSDEETSEDLVEGTDTEDDESEDADADSDSEEEEEEEETVAYVTDEEEIARCEVVAENDEAIMYLDRDYERIGVYVKASGKVWWTNCVNALLDDATTKSSLQENRLSNIAVRYGNATDLIVSAYIYSYRQSTDKEDTEFELVDNGVKVTYTFSSAKATVPVYYILEDTYLRCYINTSEIKEKAGYVDGEDAQESDSDVLILTELAMNPYFGAADSEAEGYMLVADGSGAIINLNNGKGNYSNYSSTIYGRDAADVKDNQPDEVEQVTMPVMAMVQGSDGLVMVATQGDTFASANAAVAYNSDDNCGYNYCYFSFTLRSTDTYSMSGDSSSIIMFEKGDGSIAVETLEVRYYWVTSEEEEVTVTEIADVYRDYLIEEEGLTAKAESDYAPLFVEFYGGTLKSKSILGIPVNLKTAFTTFDQAAEILEELVELGVDQLVVNYNDWTTDSMTGKLDTADSVASVLGGKSDLEDLIEYCESIGAQFYGSITDYTFSSNGNGFWTLFNTAYRVSKSYARPYEYNIAYGTPNDGVASALLSPRSISKLSTKVTKNLDKYDLPGAGLGSYANTLWGDYSNKNRTNREVTAQYIVDYYKSVAGVVDSIIADAPNAYLYSYVDVIQNLTLQSSQFKIFDEDVPFVQIVLHGYIPYSTEAINGSADSMELFLKAIASGSYVKYTFIYEETTEIEDTDYINLYYANYAGWLEQAAAEYELASEILAPVSDAVITGYETDGSVITTTYDNGYVTTVDLTTGEITANGKTYNYSDYVDEGGILNG